MIPPLQPFRGGAFRDRRPGIGADPRNHSRRGALMQEWLSGPTLGRRKA
jgi:hypothetical protein